MISVKGETSYSATAAWISIVTFIVWKSSDPAIHDTLGLLVFAVFFGALVRSLNSWLAYKVSVAGLILGGLILAASEAFMYYYSNEPISGSIEFGYQLTIISLISFAYYFLNGPGPAGRGGISEIQH